MAYAFLFGGGKLRPPKHLPQSNTVGECSGLFYIIGEIKKTRQEKGYSQQKLSDLSGVRQPIIARMEKGKTTPQLETVLKILYPMDKKLAVVPNDTLKGGADS